MTAKTVIGLGAGEIVEEPEQSESDARGHHQDPGGAGRRVSYPERAEQRAPGLDEQHGEHCQHPGPGRNGPPAMVRAFERRRAQQIRGQPDQQPDRQHADDEPDQDAHDGSGGRASVAPSP